MTGITHIPTEYPRYYPSLQPKTSQLLMNLLMHGIKTQQAEKAAEKRREEKKYDSLEQWKREVTHSVTMADKAQENRRGLMVEQRQHVVKMQGWTEVDPKKIPMESWDQEHYQIGEKYYRKPEQPHARVAPIAGSSHKILTWQSNGKQNAKILNPAEVSQWDEKKEHFDKLFAAGDITRNQYEKGLGIYITKKPISMHKQLQGGVNTVQVQSDEVKKFEGMGYSRVKFTPTEKGWSEPEAAVEGNKEGLTPGTSFQRGPKGQIKVLEKPTKAKIPQLNALIKSGEQLIAKGMGMDVALMDKFDTNRQKAYFDTLKLYHKILEVKPELQTEMGVRKSVNFANKVSKIAVNKEGVVIGKDKVSGKWITLE